MIRALFHRLRSVPILCRLAGDQCGQSLTEFALVAPILFVILFGVIDFGKAMNYWNDETQLAAMGARMAAVSGGNVSPGGTCADGSPAPAALDAYIQCQADTKELRSGSTFVTKAVVSITFPNNGQQGVGCPVRVTVSSTYTWLPVLNLHLMGINLNLGSTPMVQSSTQRLERAWNTSAPPCSA